MPTHISHQARSGQVDTLLISNDHAQAEISLFGGQVLSFVPAADGRERLWLSPAALWDGSRSLRGGIPVCWPWFGAHPEEHQQFPAHGYVRTRPWSVLDCQEDQDGTLLTLAPDESTGPGHDGILDVQLEVLIGAQLRLRLISRNQGQVETALSCALHTYFQVEDIRAVELRGLQGDYSDKIRHWEIFSTPQPYRFSAATDRIHRHAAPLLSLVEGKNETRIQSAGHDSIVVWNPWEGGKAPLSDVPSEGYRQMLCVETALTRGFTLAAGASHTMSQTIY